MLSSAKCTETVGRLDLIIAAHGHSHGGGGGHGHSHGGTPKKQAEAVPLKEKGKRWEFGGCDTYITCGLWLESEMTVGYFFKKQGNRHGTMPICCYPIVWKPE